jgi:SAM-dependent methyltransferase
MVETRKIDNNSVLMSDENRRNIITEDTWNKKLNLGCGNDYIDDYINVDVDPSVKADVYCDLDDSEVKLPFEDDEFDFVYMCHILEHITYLPALKRELRRIVQAPGMLCIIVPHFTSMDAWGDDTHVRAFSEHSFFALYWPGFELDNQDKIVVTDCWGNKNDWIMAGMVKLPDRGGEITI